MRAAPRAAAGVATLAAEPAVAALLCDLLAPAPPAANGDAAADGDGAPAALAGAIDAVALAAAAAAAAEAAAPPSWAAALAARVRQSCVCAAALDRLLGGELRALHTLLASGGAPAADAERAPTRRPSSSRRRRASAR